MNPHLLKIQLRPEHSFNVRYDIVPQFYDKWHYHDEIELVYIIKGSGKQFVGDVIHHFEPDDMLLLGANLPHLWHSDKKFLRKGSKLKLEAIVIHFMPDCFGKDFFQLPENKKLRSLLFKSQQGLRIQGASKREVGELMQKLLVAKGSERILLLLHILHILSESRSLEAVCNNWLHFQYRPTETDRLNTIYQYILHNFQTEISLNDISKVAHLNPHSFCRYFKSRIKKTFTRFLIEIRIGHACKLLAETNKTVAAICFESGYNNFSNFNRHFKSIIGKTPLEYRKVY